MTMLFPTPDRLAATAPTEVLDFYDRDGYYVLENGFSIAEVEEMRAEAARVGAGEAGPLPGGEPRRPGETDDELLRRFLCIHFPHKISSVMRRALSHPTVVEVLTRVIGPDVKCMQSLLFIKAAGKPGQAWHQDEDYIPTRHRPPSSLPSTPGSACAWLCWSARS
jgi:phytanoyl-CoA hydroxylase